MTIKRLSGLKKIVAVASLVGAQIAGLAGGIARAEDLETCVEEKGISLSVKPSMEFTGKDDDFSTRTGLRVAEESGNDFFRVFNYTGKGKDYTEAGVRVPLQVGNLKNEPSLWGVEGDKQGIGFMNVACFKDLEIIANAEQASIPNTSNRLGGEVNYNLGNVKVGIGGDNVENKGVTNNSLLGHVIYFGEKNQFGTALRTLDSEGSTTNSVVGYWSHFGPEEKVGTRTWLKVDENGSKTTYTLDSITSQNPTFGNLSSRWIVGRLYGDMFDTGIVTNPLAPERIALPNRSRQGAVGELKFSADSNGDGCAFGEVGYKFNRVDFGFTGVQPSFTINYERGFGSDIYEKVGASFLGSWNNNICTEIGVKVPTCGSSGAETYAQIGFSCPIGNSKRK